eukprot:m.95120 g.95120  ORF g.95120 m.95120 type:complete len:567 (+) comp8592_c0_seq1:310-2010(+)
MEADARRLARAAKAGARQRQRHTRGGAAGQPLATHGQGAARQPSATGCGRRRFTSRERLADGGVNDIIPDLINTTCQLAALQCTADDGADERRRWPRRYNRRRRDCQGCNFRRRLSFRVFEALTVEFASDFFRRLWGPWRLHGRTASCTALRQGAKAGKHGGSIPLLGEGNGRAVDRLQWQCRQLVDHIWPPDAQAQQQGLALADVQVLKLFQDSEVVDLRQRVEVRVRKRQGRHSGKARAKLWEEWRKKIEENEVEAHSRDLLRPRAIERVERLAIYVQRVAIELDEILAGLYWPQYWHPGRRGSAQRSRRCLPHLRRLRRRGQGGRLRAADVVGGARLQGREDLLPAQLRSLDRLLLLDLLLQRPLHLLPPLILLAAHQAGEPALLVRDAAAVQQAQRRDAVDEVVAVRSLAAHGVVVKGQLGEDRQLADRDDIIRMLHLVVAQKQSLKAGQVQRRARKANLVASQVQLGEGGQTGDVIDPGDAVTRKIQHTQLLQARQARDLLDAVPVDVQDVQARHVLKVLEAADAIASQHQHAQRRDRGEALDGLDLVVVEVQEDQTSEGV